ncbi:MAG: NfeD family protein [Pseudomonadota bacterium]
MHAVTRSYPNRLLAVFALLLAGLITVSAQTTAKPEPGASSTEPAKSTSTPTDYGKVGYASLTGPIDRLRHRYLDRVIDDARKNSLDTLILHIDTDGGEVSHAREMFKAVLDQRKHGIRMIAFVDFRAISAGAMVSYAHDAIYISPGASIGDIGVIFVSREGEMKYAPEKVETVVRSLLTQAAEIRGWDRALLLKMTARTQKLYRVKLPDGTERYVIEDDLPELLSKHPTLDLENRQQIYVYRGEDRLLTLTGQEAARLGMATGLAQDLPDLYEQLGVNEEKVLDLTPRTSELTAWSLSTFAPMLAGLAVLFIMFEIKTPGVGLWALLAAICGAGFALSQYYLDMAEHIEVVLIVVGVLLLGLDAVLGIGAGVLAVIGAGVALFGLIMSFVPNELDFDLTDPVFQDALKDAVLASLVSLGVVVAGVVLFIAVMPKMSVRNRFAVAAEVGGTSAGALEQAADTLVGQRGTAREALRPSGLIDVGGASHSARAEHGTYIDAGSDIEVVAVQFGEIVVRAAMATAEAGR